MIQLFIYKAMRILSGLAFSLMLLFMALIFIVKEDRIRLIFFAAGSAVLFGIFAFLAEKIRVPDRMDDLISEVKKK